MVQIMQDSVLLNQVHQLLGVILVLVMVQLLYIVLVLRIVVTLFYISVTMLTKQLNLQQMQQILLVFGLKNGMLLVLWD